MSSQPRVIEGLLGFQNMRVLNQTHMMKFAWHLLVDWDKLWVQIMRAKYSCGAHTMPTVIQRSNSSPIWHAIVQNWGLVNNKWRGSFAMGKVRVSRGTCGSRIVVISWTMLLQLGLLVRKNFTLATMLIMVFGGGRFCMIVYQRMFALKSLL